MNPELFILALAAGLVVLYGWAFRTLPQEHWQIIAAVPVRKTEAGAWHGVNFTYYGFFVASSNVLATLVLLLLLHAAGVAWWATAVLVVALFGLCWPAARLIARVVEKKAYTFTVGGAVFVGGLVAPWLIVGINALGPQVVLPVWPTLAALAVAYVYGESVGRLACLSFGCCYGKRLTQLAPRWQRLFARIVIVFRGATKKAAYAGGLEGVPVVPVQALTACVLALLALSGTALFLHGWFRAAFLLTLAASQLWRFVSERLREDERGPAQTISAYQVMALVLVAYLFLLAGGLEATTTTRAPDLLRGLRALWHPAVVLLTQALWLALFWHTGRSSVTGAELTFFVHRTRI